MNITGTRNVQLPKNQQIILPHFRETVFFKQPLRFTAHTNTSRTCTWISLFSWHFKETVFLVTTWIYLNHNISPVGTLI